MVKNKIDWNGLTLGDKLFLLLCGALIFGLIVYGIVRWFAK